MLNHIILQGRLVGDADLRHTQAGKAYANYRIAVERNFRDADGERGADFINCTSFGQQGEMVAQYFHKGDMILVSGSLQIRSYTDRNGQSRTAASVAVNEVNFCGGKRADPQPYAQEPTYSRAPAPEQPPEPPKFEDMPDDGELPF